MPKRFNRTMELRQLTGMSQEEMAAMLHTSRSAIAMFETTGRGLPNDASLYQACILVEMNKPENQALVATDSLSTASSEQWKKELQQLAAQRRYEAEQLKRKMEAYSKKEHDRRNRLLLIHCVEKVQALLTEQTRDSPWKPVTDCRVKWLELEKSLNGYLRFNEKAQLKHLRDQLRYNMLLKEAEEAERLAGEIE